jgi:predicted lactoylglutathione lyase
LAVKDIAAARAFYEKSGFEVSGADTSQNWLTMKNGDPVIGLSRGCSRRTSSHSTPVR